MLVRAGTTLHSQAGCGVPRIYKDFGRMWNKLPLARWRSLKVLCRSCSLAPCWSNSTLCCSSGWCGGSDARVVRGIHV